MTAEAEVWVARTGGEPWGEMVGEEHPRQRQAKKRRPSLQVAEESGTRWMEQCAGRQSEQRRWTDTERMGTAREQKRANNWAQTGVVDMN